MVNMEQNILQAAKRVVIKVGGSHLVNYQTGHFDKDWLDALVENVAKLKAMGKEVVIVSSGAMAFGLRVLKYDMYKSKLLDKQALACVGQVELMERYKSSFSKHSIDVAQVLLTIEDIENRKRYLSARTVIEHLISNGVVPIINENDAIATAEIRFGDNDRLSARVAQMASAEVLILLSSCDGLFTDNPQIERNADFIKEVYDINADIEKMAGDSADGSGGMSAKIVAAKTALGYNCKVVIANGTNKNIITNLLNGEGRATWFIPNHNSNMKYLKE
jgi:glutamate 5-kinase